MRKGFNRVFWFVGGFNVTALEKPECEFVRSKYSCIGALVLLTALLAFCSGSYALYTVFHNLHFSFAFALLWGFLILFIDRFLVSSSRKVGWITPIGTESHTKGFPFRSKMNMSLLLRFPLAVIIGFVVSKPLEVRLLTPLINEHEREKAMNQKELIANDKDLIKLDATIARLNAEVSQVYERVRQTGNIAELELDGKAASRKSGPGHYYNEKNAQYQDALRSERALQAQLDLLVSERTARHDGLSTDTDSDITNRTVERSIVNDLVDIQEIIASGGVRGRKVDWLSWSLVGLFVLVETMPMLAKLLSDFDPYDATLQQIEHEAILNSLISAQRKHGEASDSGIAYRMSI